MPDLQYTHEHLYRRCITFRGVDSHKSENMINPLAFRLTSYLVFESELVQLVELLHVVTNLCANQNYTTTFRVLHNHYHKVQVVIYCQIKEVISENDPT